MKNTKAHLITILVIDTENMSNEDIKIELENVKYLYPKVVNINTKHIGVWEDSHMLNSKNTTTEQIIQFFNT